MHPDDLKSGDLLREDRKPHEAMEVYLTNLKKRSKNVALHPDAGLAGTRDRGY